jgi:hypothetical protein
MTKFKKEDEIPELFEIAGGRYYFDLDQLSHFIRIEKPESVDDILGEVKKEMEDNDSEEDDDESNPMDAYAQIIDVTKWETTKVMIESVLSEQGPVDEAMGYTKLSSQLSIPFKLSFNTLLNYKIIKEQNGR